MNRFVFQPKFVLYALVSGFGFAPMSNSNAIYVANTPNIDGYFHTHSFSLLDTNIEHTEPHDRLTRTLRLMGQGSLLPHAKHRVDSMIGSSNLGEHEVLKEVAQHTKVHRANIHVFFCVDADGVWGDVEHLFGILRALVDAGSNPNRILVHLVLQGDWSQIAERVIEISKRLLTTGTGNLSTVVGIANLLYAADLYEHNTLDGYTNVGDVIKINIDKSAQELEFTNILNFDDKFDSLNSGDVIFFANYKNDELQNFVLQLESENKYKCIFWEHSDTTRSLLSDTQPNFGSIAHHLSKNSHTQLKFVRQKRADQIFAHFDGALQPLAGEDRSVCLDEVGPQEYFDIFFEKIAKKDYGFILFDFDFVDQSARSGDFDAVVASLEVLDKNIKTLVDFATSNGGCVVLTSDQGNAEDMFGHGNINPHPTNNPVPFLLLGHKDSIKIKSTGHVEDIAPTLLALYAHDKPVHMTGQSLIQFHSS